MRFYIATKLERAAEATALAKRLEGMGHELTYSWMRHGSVNDEGPARIAEVAELEAQGVQNASCVIVLLPGGRGTHTELGIAIGLALARGSVAAGAPKILLVGDQLDESGRTCALYSHPAVTRLADVEEAIRWVRGWYGEQA